MKTIFRLLCGWMAIALAACTGDELQQIEPLQKPVAQKTISVKAYTPSEQAATRLDFTEETDGSLSLAWSAGDAFTALIDNNKVRFEYDEDSKEFTANVAQDVTLTDGIVAYYPAYDGENFEMDFSRQTGLLNGATTYMEGVYEGDAFSFTHSTAILKASFSDLPQNATISSVGIDVVAGENSFQIAISQPDNDLYINLPAIAKDGTLTFDVRTSDGTLYTATKTVTVEEGIETGVYYNTAVALSPAPVCNLPTGGEFNSAVKSFLSENSSLTKIKFIAKSDPWGSEEHPTPIGGCEAYMVPDSDNETLEIHTAAAEFVFNADCTGMFDGLDTITAIDFNNCVNTSNVTNMYAMFSDCPLLESLDLSSFNTAKVENMNAMFLNCSSLESLNVSSFNTANVTNMGSMFSDCSKLTSLNVSSFNTEKVTNMAYMFYDCKKLTSLDLSSFNTANVTDMKYMFDDCCLLNSLNVSSFNTSNVENMYAMFSGCSALSSLDLSSFDFNGVENRGDEHFSQMFYCLGESAAHRPIPVYVTLAGYEILSKKSMTGIDDSYAQLVALCELPTGNSFNSAVKSFLSENSSLTKIKFVANSSNTNTSKPISSISGAYMVAGSDNTLEIHTSAAGFLFNEDCNHMFSSLSAITAINFNNSVNTAKVTNMSYMFYDCQKLTSLNVSSFNTANVTDMSYMFSHCSAFTSLDLSSFNTANVTNMTYMFRLCSALTSLNVSNFNTEKVTDMSNMFVGCFSLESLDLSSFDFGKVANFSGMFTDLGKNVSLPLVYIYVKDENDKIILKSANTYISKSHVIISVKQP